VGLITLPPSCVECHEVWKPQPPGRQGLYRDCFIFTFAIYYVASNTEVTEYLIDHCLPGNYMLLGNAVRRRSQ